MSKIILFALFIFLGSVQQVSAHAEGLVPFLTINGVFPDINPVSRETVIPTSFSVPEDLARDKILVNEEIRFVIDTAVLATVYPQDVLNKITYKWELGDGTTAEGIEVKHTYKTIGSKVVTIYADFSDESVELAPQPIEVVQLDILPNTAYQLPQAVITANKKAFRNEPQEVNMKGPIKFDIDVKNTPSAEIVAYAWDFNEGGKSSEKSPVHTYTTNPTIVTPIVRLTDNNGFIVYAHTMLTNAKNTEGYTFATNTVGTVILGVQAIVVIVGLIWFAVAVRKKKHR